MGSAAWLTAEVAQSVNSANVAVEIRLSVRVFIANGSSVVERRFG
jgi:hypothetical protein